MTDIGPTPSGAPDAIGRPDPIAQARIAFEVWRGEPPYGTALRDTTTARAAAVHLGNVLAAYDAVVAERDAARARLVEVEARNAVLSDELNRVAPFLALHSVSGYTMVKPDDAATSGAVSPRVGKVSVEIGNDEWLVLKSLFGGTYLSLDIDAEVCARALKRLIACEWIDTYDEDDGPSYYITDKGRVAWRQHRDGHGTTGGGA